jgi:MarR family transcriptional regulator for hemolysin
LPCAADRLGFVQEGELMSLNDDFVGAVCDAALKWRTHFDAELKRSGQTLRRARALILLAQEPGGMMQRDLAAELSIEHPALVGILDSLERQRLIARAQVPGDKGANRIVLTPAAEPVVAQVNGLFEGLCDGILRSIPPEDLATATRVFSIVAESLNADDTYRRRAVAAADAAARALLVGAPAAALSAAEAAARAVLLFAAADGARSRALREAGTADRLLELARLSGRAAGRSAAPWGTASARKALAAVEEAFRRLGWRHGGTP